MRRVAVTLRLYGIDYRHVPLMPFGPDKAELATFNPIARVPALQLGDGEMLIDSAAILDYLDGLVGPERALTPAVGAGAAARADADWRSHSAPTKSWSPRSTSGISGRARHGTRPGSTPATSRCATALPGWRRICRTVVHWAPSMTQADVTVAVFWLFGRAKRPNFFAGLGCARLDELAERLQATPAFQATMPEPETLTKRDSGRRSSPSFRDGPKDQTSMRNCTSDVRCFASLPE